MKDSLKKLKTICKINEIKERKQLLHVAAHKNSLLIEQRQLQALQEYRSDYQQRKITSLGNDIWHWSNLDKFLNSIDEIIKKQNSQVIACQTRLDQELAILAKIKNKSKVFEELYNSKFDDHLKNIEKKSDEQVIDLFNSSTASTQALDNIEN